MQKGTKKFVLPIIFLILCGFIAFIFYTGWIGMVEAGYHSCIASIASVIQKSETAKNLVENGKDWRVLNEQEVDILMSQVQGYDCSVDNQTLDIWNNRINVALRKRGIIEVVVWSNGADGISGTEDDLVIPFGEKVPQ